MITQSGPTIAASPGPYNVGDFRDITIYGGDPGTDGTLEWNNGEGEANSVPFTYNDEGHAVVRVLVPAWEGINFSIDPNGWQDDVYRTINP